MKYTPFIHIEFLEKENQLAGKCWFNADTTSFFNSKYPEKAYASDPNSDIWYFVTSEREPRGVRRYSIRQYDLTTNNCRTVGEFMAYNTSHEAYKALAQLLADEINEQIQGLQE